MLALALAPWTVHAGSGFLDADISIEYDSNVGRAENSGDRKDDIITTVAAGAGFNLVVNAFSGLSLKAEARFARFAELESLNRMELTGSADYTIQPSHGFLAPWYTLSVSGTLSEFSDSDIREGAKLNLGAVAGKRFTDRITLAGGYRYRHRDPRRGALFRTKSHTGFANVDYRLADSTVVYGSYSLGRGDVVSTAPFSTRIASVSKARGPDQAFGAGFRAWRIKATTQVFQLGANVRLNRAHALDIGAHYFDSAGKGGNDYDGFNVSVSWLARFR